MPGGVTCSDFEQVQGQAHYYWERDDVLRKRYSRMTAAFAHVYDRAEREQATLRAAALIAIERVAPACRGRDGCEMSLYAMVGSGIGTNEAADLTARLSAWHDAMVAHERRLRNGSSGDRCDDECPHAEARGLWPEALATFGPRANQLAFLRSRAHDSARHPGGDAAREVRAEAADRHGRPRASRADGALRDGSDRARRAAEL